VPGDPTGEPSVGLPGDPPVELPVERPAGAQPPWPPPR
jgi:hypothetical protein